jgi:hypothetical protein
MARCWRGCNAADPAGLVKVGATEGLGTLLLAQFFCLSERMMRSASASASGISMTVFNACRALSYWRSSCASAVVALRTVALHQNDIAS